MNYSEDRAVTLPKRKVHKTPRLLLGDAYTIGSNKFESPEAKEKSVYYVTFRKNLHTINPHIYSKEDNRIIFIGLQRILEKLFYEPITHAEIDETKRFLAHAKVTMDGFKEYEFPEEIWRRVVDEFNGRPPIKIRAVREGSVIYPNEPAIEIISDIEGMGVLGAWFESKILQTWSTTERVTQDEHFLLRIKERILRVDPDMSEEMLNFWASIMITDFGDRAGMTIEESEELGMAHLYTFGGTDTFSGAYQAWKNSNEAVGVFSSVNALAHRNVQSYQNENDCYEAIYNSCKNNEIISCVDDCYDAKNAVRTMLLPLALRSLKEGNGKVIVARPDSSKDGYTTLDQIIEICDLSVENGLFTEITTKTGTWKCGTLLHFLDGDGKSCEEILDEIDALIERGYAFYTWGLFGQGGGLRNNLKRDNLSAKYALASVSADNTPVVKFSETLGKGTLPGPFKLLRTQEALASKKTICFEHEDGDDVMVTYFDGTKKHKPFGDGQDDEFLDIKANIKKQMAEMPLSLGTIENHNYPASDKIMETKQALLIKYAPNKQLETI
jgi:nicotinamide phosphoribosyltransferase